jgi:SAM-dependent methyltransferase
MASDPSSPPPRLIRFYRWIWRFWRERRFQRFVDALNPTPADVLLDIGGYPFNWFKRGEVIGHVDVLNLELLPLVEDAPAGAPEIRAIAGDARRLQFPDGQYDIVFSNSVIEHVGTWEDQQAFATEARRVGRGLWIQTPARECPVEPHYLGIFIHWFPPRWQVPMARWLSFRGLTGSANRNDLTEIARSTRLLTKSEMSRLFPDCRIWTEKLFGIIPKSYVAIRNQSDKPMNRTLP